MSTNRPIRLLLVDDHTLFRRGLKALLSQDERFLVAGEAGDVGEALRCLAQQRPDVILLDNHLPGVRGVDAIPALKEAAPEARVLMLTVSENENDLAAALQAGADGYLLKDTPRDDLVEAVRAAARGETVLAPSVARRLVAQVRGGDQRLTARELEVLAAVARGLSNPQVGAELYITEATVKTHLLRAYGKLGVDSRTGAVTEALRRGLLDLG